MKAIINPMGKSVNFSLKKFLYFWDIKDSIAVD